MVKQTPLLFGIDFSLNHWAICRVDYLTGSCLDYRYMTCTKKEYNQNAANAFLLEGQDKKNGEGKETYGERRRAFSVQILFKYIMDILNGLEKAPEDVYVSIEGYAYAASTRGLCQIAEATGLLKTMLYNQGIKLRIHDPLSVKLYASGGGACLKKTIVLAAKDLGFHISESLLKVKRKKIKGLEVEEYDGVGTDLADSFFLARILRTELMLRDGIASLENLKECERKIFLRVTKAFPENILSRDFIQKEQQC